eukprot:jgi/Botrbrau1/1661/Bobra.116_2s0005.1
MGADSRAWLGQLLLIAILVCVPSAVPEAVVPWSLYHKTDFILETCKKTALKLPNRVRYEEIPDPLSDVSLPLVTITDFTTGENGKEVILIVAGEHSRELITSEIAFWLGKLLSGQTKEELIDWGAYQSVQEGVWASGLSKDKLTDWVDTILKRVIFKIIPVENILGRKAVEGGRTCLRKTAAGVDLNRNWEYAWQQVDEASDVYGGKKPFSEAESRVVKLIAETVRPRAYVNLHSGEWAMYVPWDSKRELAPDLPADTLEVLEKMNIFCECMNGAAGKVAGYLAFGSSMDYMYVKEHVPYSLTFEVFGPDGLGKIARGGKPRRHLSGEGLEAEGVPELDLNLAEDAAETSQPLLSMQALRRSLLRLVKGEAVSENAAAGNAESELERCVRDYNPIQPEEYQEVVARWLGVFLVLGDHLATHPAASRAQHTAEQEEQPKPPNPPSLMDLAIKGKVAEQEQQQPSDFMKALSLLGKRGSTLAQGFQLPTNINPWASPPGEGAASIMWLPLTVGAVAALAYLGWVWARRWAGSNGRLPRVRRGPQKARIV